MERQINYISGGIMSINKKPGTKKCSGLPTSSAIVK
jgi:hypothetical protein